MAKRRAPVEDDEDFEPQLAGVSSPPYGGGGSALGLGSPTSALAQFAALHPTARLVAQAGSRNVAAAVGMAVIGKALGLGTQGSVVGYALSSIAWGYWCSQTDPAEGAVTMMPGVFVLASWLFRHAARHLAYVFPAAGVVALPEVTLTPLPYPTHGSDAWASRAA